jgi:hypothetical protein
MPNMPILSLALATSASLGLADRILPRTFKFYDSTGPLEVSSSSSSSGCDKVFFPAQGAAVPEGGWPVYQFNCGTGQKPAMYTATLKHIASHGFVAAANLMDPWGSTTIPKAEACLTAIQTGSLPVPVNAKQVVVGGHSGGGPTALILASRHSLQGYVGQHAASIPFVNRPSDKVIKGITGSVLQMCGTIDVMPDCGCGPATNDYFDRYPASTPSMLAKSPDGHVEGTEGPTGNKAEGGLVVAFLYHVLRSDPDARAALVKSGSRSGYSIVDKLTDAQNATATA